MADRIVVMTEGLIQQTGSPREIYRQPENRFVAEFVGANSIMSGEVVAINGQDVTIATALSPFTVRATDRPMPTVSERAAFLLYADRIREQRRRHPARTRLRRGDAHLHPGA
jgi:spermidine/putrescine transport system ATP-binding protein